MLVDNSILFLVRILVCLLNHDSIFFR